MSNILKDRIKELRRALGLNQTEFGVRLGIAQGTVAGYETGFRTPAPSTLMLIEKEYGVSPEWLESGIGSMFEPTDRQTEIAAFVAKSLISENGIKETFLWVLSQLSEDTWSELEQIAAKLLEEEKRKKPDQN